MGVSPEYLLSPIRDKFVLAAREQMALLVSRSPFQAKNENTQQRQHVGRCLGIRGTTGGMRWGGGRVTGVSAGDRGEQGPSTENSGEPSPMTFPCVSPAIITGLAYTTEALLACPNLGRCAVCCRGVGSGGVVRLSGRPVARPLTE